MTNSKTKQPKIPPEVVGRALRLFDEQKKAEEQHLQRFGHVLPVVSMHAFGKRIVGAGQNLLSSPNWKVFSDFPWDYLPFVFGAEWSARESEQSKSEYHPVSQWRSTILQHARTLPVSDDGRVAVKMNGLLMAYLSVAYDIYIVEQNNRLDADFLERLKHREHFQGARHELCAEATCLRAGFKVERENERDRKQRHAEFTAEHKLTGVKLSVEAKSKHRKGVLGVPGTERSAEDIRFRVGELINDAVKKEPVHPLVIFIDTNLPARAAQRFFPTVPDPSTGTVKKLLDEIAKKYGGRDPYSLVVFTNLPYHYASIDDPLTEKHYFSTGPVPEPGDKGATARMAALRAIHDAAMLHGNIPQEFP